MLNYYNRGFNKPEPRPPIFSRRYENNPVLKYFDKIRKYFGRYCDMTSLHGFRYLTEQNITFLERIFWVAAIVTATICSCDLVYKSIMKYQSSPLMSQLDPVGLPVWHTPFPAITICNDNQFKYSMFKYTELMDKLNITETEKKQVAVADMLCDTDDDGDNEFLDTDMFNYMVKYVVPTLNETVDNAVRLPNRSKSVMDYFQTTFTPNGVCHTLNGLPHQHVFRANYFDLIKGIEIERGEYISEDSMEGMEFWDRDTGYPTQSENVYPWRVGSDGVAGTTVIILKYNPDDYDENCSRGSRGFTISVHSPMELSSPFTTKIYLEPNKLIKIYVQVTKQETADILRWWPPKQRGCYFTNERQLEFYLNYTLRNCDNECRSLISFEYCGCVSFYHPRNSSIPICGPKKWECLWESYRRSEDLMKEKNKALIKRCNCLLPCKFTVYQAEHSTKQFNMAGRSFYRSLMQNYSDKLQYSVIQISFKERRITVTNKTAFITFADFLGNLGGIMGLFLGFSFLSLIELIYFLTIRVVFKLWNYKRNKQNQNIQLPTLDNKQQPVKFIWMP